MVLTDLNYKSSIYRISIVYLSENLTDGRIITRARRPILSIKSDKKELFHEGQ